VVEFVQKSNFHGPGFGRPQQCAAPLPHFSFFYFSSVIFEQSQSPGAQSCSTQTVQTITSTILKKTQLSAEEERTQGQHRSRERERERERFSVFSHPSLPPSCYFDGIVVMERAIVTRGCAPIRGATASKQGCRAFFDNFDGSDLPFPANSH
jgi:hypothetical protein